MYDSYSKGISYTSGFFMLIAFTVAGFFLASLISIPVWTQMTGISITKMEEAMSDPRNSNAVKVIQCITAVVAFLVPALFTAYMLNRRPMKLLGFSGKINWQQVGLVCAIVVSALFVSAFMAYLNDRLPISEAWKLKFDKMESEYNKQVEAIVSLNSTADYLLALFIMAFIPALCEETLFRGGLQNFLTRSTHKPWLSIIIVSLIFSAAHFSYYGFLSRFFLGLILGLLYQYSGKLWLTIIAHFLNNALAVSLLYSLKLEGKPVKEAISENSATWVGVFALPVVIGLLVLFRKISASLKEPEPPVKEGREELRNTPFY